MSRPKAGVGALPGRPLADLYDLRLSSDYENLNTSTEDNGRLLKARLEAVDLGAGNDKSLDIQALDGGWSLGSSSSTRGNHVARRLAVLGTPNGGSPVTRVVYTATVALGLSRIARGMADRSTQDPAAGQPSCDDGGGRPDRFPVPA